MATSTYFSWPEPDNTDLVKNGALAIRTAVNAIDTSMSELLGGTTGQVLSKTSNTSMDFTWVTTDDTNAIQNAIVDAKGDIIAASANDTPARLAVGANDLLLTAASGEATGLKYTGAWTSYTPTYSAGFVIGNGTVVSKYQQVGKLVTVYYQLTWGTTTAVTNFATVSLPVTGVTDGYYNGTATYTDVGVSNYQGTGWQASTTTWYFLCPTTLGTYLGFSPASTTAPATFGNTDQWRLIMTYEVA
jgi:hypothetical protein